MELQWLAHWWLIYHGCFELVIESLGKNPKAADLRKFRSIFLFILKMVYCVFSLESPRWGDSNENAHNTFMLKKMEKIPLLCLLIWRDDQPSLARTTPVSNIFSWFHRCSSHWSSTVILFALRYQIKGALPKLHQFLRMQFFCFKIDSHLTEKLTERKKRK